MGPIVHVAAAAALATRRVVQNTAQKTQSSPTKGDRGSLEVTVEFSKINTLMSLARIQGESLDALNQRVKESIQDAFNSDAGVEIRENEFAREPLSALTWKTMAGNNSNTLFVLLRPDS